MACFAGVTQKDTKYEESEVSAHSALERVDLTGVGLDLVSVLHGLLFGLTQCIIVLSHSLVQIRHLRREAGEFNS